MISQMGAKRIGKTHLSSTISFRTYTKPIILAPFLSSPFITLLFFSFHYLSKAAPNSFYPDIAILSPSSIIVNIKSISSSLWRSQNSIIYEDSQPMSHTGLSQNEMDMVAVKEWRPIVNDLNWNWVGFLINPPKGPIGQLVLFKPEDASHKMWPWNDSWKQQEKEQFESNKRIESQVLWLSIIRLSLSLI